MGTLEAKPNFLSGEIPHMTCLNFTLAGVKVYSMNMNLYKEIPN